MNTATVKPITPWLMLVSRTLLFVAFQLLIAGVLSVTGSSAAAWGDSAGWWPLSALCANLVSILLLIWLFRKENKGYFDFTHYSPQTKWKDIGIVLLLVIAFIPLVTFPNQWLADALFGSSKVVFALFFRPLPLWAGIVSLLFPITIAFAELPTYFGYVMPRLEAQLGNGWLAWGLASLFLAAQHMALPLIFDGRFMLWRFGMFLPLAFFMGLCLKLRPQLFPYFMFVHILIDMMTVVIILTL